MSQRWDERAKFDERWLEFCLNPKFEWEKKRRWIASRALRSRGIHFRRVERRDVQDYFHPNKKYFFLISKCSSEALKNGLIIQLSTEKVLLKLNISFEKFRNLSAKCYFKFNSEWGQDPTRFPIYCPLFPSLLWNFCLPFLLSTMDQYFENHPSSPHNTSSNQKI